MRFELKVQLAKNLVITIGARTHKINEPEIY